MPDPAIQGALRLVDHHDGPVREEPLVPTLVLGVLIFVLTEAMMFSGLISAFLIVKSSVAGGVWPPPYLPVLPAAETAFNTAALLLSGGLVFVAQRTFEKDPAAAFKPLAAATALAVFFVAFQGVEWVALIRDGLSFTGSQHGAFFYLIVGMHSAHVLTALGFLVQQTLALRAGTLKQESFWALQVFWYFVVGLWPVLYWLVYL